jgi:hypothetical protein
MNRPWSAAALLSSCRGLLLGPVKQPVWEEALTATASGGELFELCISRVRANRHQQAGETDWDGRLVSVCNDAAYNATLLFCCTFNNQWQL